MARLLSLTGLVGAICVVAAIALTAAGRPDELHASFASAVNLVEGAEVRVGGVKVGSVEDIEAVDGVADVTMAIDDDRIWPLHEGTRARIRWGGTVAYALRYVELTPGPDGGRALEDGARLMTADTTSPVEFDDVFDIFDEPTREDLGTLVDRAAATFGGRGAELRSGLREGAPAFDELAEVLERLGADPHALRTLARAGHATAGALREREAELRDLVAGAGATFDEVADHSDATRRALARLPRTLRTVRGTLGRLDSSLEGIDGLVADLRPGAREARSLARPLASATGALSVVAPRLDETLRAVDRGAPQISRFLTEARPLLQQLAPTLDRLAPMVGCIRPYAPEFAGLFSTWHSFTTRYDKLSHYARVNFQGNRFGSLATQPVAEQQKTDPNLDYAFIRPPGYLAGDPQFLPQCGAGREGLDAAADPEARR